MSKKANPAAVGIFVAAAVLVLFAGLVVLGSGKLFEKRGRFVAYFQSDVHGLQEGSDVMLGGVKVGTVQSLHVRFDPETNQKVIPVVFELSADRIAEIAPGWKYGRDEILSDESVSDAVKERGLRARLMTKSVLTGQLFVDLAFFPEGTESYSFPGPTTDGLTQVPTTKNEIERVLEKIAEGLDKLSKLEINQTVDDLDRLIVEANDTISELDMQGLSDRAKKTLDEADATMASIRNLVSDEKVMSTISSIDGAASEVRKLVAAIDGENVNLAVADAQKAIDQIGRAAGNIADLTTPDAALQVRLNRTLANIEEVSRSVKDLADYLKRNPNALISGKKAP